MLQERLQTNTPLADYNITIVLSIIGSNAETVLKSVVCLFHSSISQRQTTIPRRTHSDVSHRFLFLLFILLLY